MKKTKKNDTENIEWLLILDKDFAQCYFSIQKEAREKLKKWKHSILHEFLFSVYTRKPNEQIITEWAKKKRPSLLAGVASPSERKDKSELWTGTWHHNHLLELIYDF